MVQHSQPNSSFLVYGGVSVNNQLTETMCWPPSSSSLEDAGKPNFTCLGSLMVSFCVLICVEMSLSH